MYVPQPYFIASSAKRTIIIIILSLRVKEKKEKGSERAPWADRNLPRVVHYWCTFSSTQKHKHTDTFSSFSTHLHTHIFWKITNNKSTSYLYYYFECVCVYLSLKFLGAKQTPKNGGGFLCVCCVLSPTTCRFSRPLDSLNDVVGGTLWKSTWRERKDHHEAERETRKCANKMDNGHVIQQVFPFSCFVLITSQKMTNKPVRFDCFVFFCFCVPKSRGSTLVGHFATHWKCGWPIGRWWLLSAFKKFDWRLLFAVISLRFPGSPRERENQTWEIVVWEIKVGHTLKKETKKKFRSAGDLFNATTDLLEGQTATDVRMRTQPATTWGGLHLAADGTERRHRHLAVDLVNACAVVEFSFWEKNKWPINSNFVSKRREKNIKKAF